MRLITWKMLTALLLFSSSNNASATVVTAYRTVTVAITVLSSCTIAVSNLTFGNYSVSALNVNTSVNVTCTNSTPYKVGLDAGSGTGATVSLRKLTSGASNTLNYSLYQDAAKTIVWGKTAGTDTVSGTGTGYPQSITVYGNIPANQVAAYGAYSDTIVATVYF